MVGYDQGNNQNGSISFSGNYSGDASGDFLLELPASAVGGVGSLGNYGGVAKYSLAEQLYWYIQDDWRVSNRLTLNLGLRWEYQSPIAAGWRTSIWLVCGSFWLDGPITLYQASDCSRKRRSAAAESSRAGGQE